MGFFAEFNTWLNAILTTYIGDNTARIAAAIEPAVVTLAVVYVMIWGYLHLTGQIEEPFVTGVKRITALALILTLSLKLWLYSSLFVDTFYNAPAQLAAAVIGAGDPVAIVDTLINHGADIGEALLQKAGFFNGNVSFYIAGYLVYLIVAFCAVYTIFLLTLSRIALSILLALGPLFLALLLFESTKRFFEAWISQLCNYALIAILTVLVAALMLALLSTAAAEAAASGGGITIAQAIRVCMAAALTFLVMRQVMPIAAGLASGLALSTFGWVSSSLRWALGGATRSTRQFARGMTDAETSRWDPLSRKAGYYLRQGAGAAWRTAVRRQNQIRTP